MQKFRGKFTTGTRVRGPTLNWCLHGNSVSLPLPSCSCSCQIRSHTGPAHTHPGHQKYACQCILQFSFIHVPGIFNTVCNSLQLNLHYKNLTLNRHTAMTSLWQYPGIGSTLQSWSHGIIAVVSPSFGSPVGQKVAVVTTPAGLPWDLPLLLPCKTLVSAIWFPMLL